MSEPTEGTVAYRGAGGEWPDSETTQTFVRLAAADGWESVPIIEAKGRTWVLMKSAPPVGDDPGPSGTDPLTQGRQDDQPDPSDVGAPR